MSAVGCTCKCNRWWGIYMEEVIEFRGKWSAAAAATWEKVPMRWSRHKQLCGMCAVHASRGEDTQSLFF